MSDLDTVLCIVGIIIFLGWFMSNAGDPDYDGDRYLGSPKDGHET